MIVIDLFHWIPHHFYLQQNSMLTVSVEIQVLSSTRSLNVGNRNQKVKVNDVLSKFFTQLPVVPQRSIYYYIIYLYPILFKIFLNGLFSTLTHSFPIYPFSPLKTSENLIFRGQRKGALRTNELKSSEIYNFADDNTIIITAKHTDILLLILKHDSDQAVRWFTQHQIIINSHKFQTMVLRSSKNVKHFEPIKFEIEKAKIKACNSKTVKLQQ